MPKIIRIITVPFRYIIYALIYIYKYTISKILPDVCIYQPTCSTYMLIAIKRFGIIRGGWMGFRRILRCNPKYQAGLDPVTDNLHHIKFIIWWAFLFFNKLFQHHNKLIQPPNQFIQQLNQLIKQLNQLIKQLNQLFKHSKKISKHLNTTQLSNQLQYIKLTIHTKLPPPHFLNIPTTFHHFKL